MSDGKSGSAHKAPYSKDIKGAQDGSDCVSAVTEQPFDGLVISIPQKPWVPEQRRVPHGHYVFEEALTAINESDIRAGVEWGPEADLMSSQSLDSLVS